MYHRLVSSGKLSPAWRVGSLGQGQGLGCGQAGTDGTGSSIANSACFRPELGVGGRMTLLDKGSWMFFLLLD
jgi:hypothetical protein